MQKIIHAVSGVRAAVLARWLAAPVALLVSAPALAGACCVVGALCCGMPCCE